jgi:hypothetical protein
MDRESSVPGIGNDVSVSCSLIIFKILVHGGGGGGGDGANPLPPPLFFPFSFLFFLLIVVFLNFSLFSSINHVSSSSSLLVPHPFFSAIYALLKKKAKFRTDRVQIRINSHVRITWLN